MNDILVSILSGLTLIAVGLYRRIASERHGEILSSLSDEIRAIEEMRREIELLRAVVCRADGKPDRSSASAVVERPTTSEQD